MFVNAIELYHTAFGITPKRFNTAHMIRAMSGLIRAVINAKVFVITDINKFIIATPTIGFLYWPYLW